MEIDHLTVPVREYLRSRRFYERALRPLGFVVLRDWPDRRRAHFGLVHRPSSLWLLESDLAGSLEVSLAAADSNGVDAFHAAAVAAGGQSGSEPAIRPEHNREYYAARVFDPDGNSIEAVFRGAPAARESRRWLAA